MRVGGYLGVPPGPALQAASVQNQNLITNLQLLLVVVDGLNTCIAGAVPEGHPEPVPLQIKKPRSRERGL
jgi:hypothetical protein